MFSPVNLVLSLCKLLEKYIESVIKFLMEWVMNLGFFVPSWFSLYCGFCIIFCSVHPFHTKWSLDRTTMVENCRIKQFYFKNLLLQLFLYVSIIGFLIEASSHNLCCIFVVVLSGDSWWALCCLMWKVLHPPLFGMRNLCHFLCNFAIR